MRGMPRVPLVCKAKSRICNSSHGRIMMIQGGSQFLLVKWIKNCHVLWPEGRKRAALLWLLVVEKHDCCVFQPKKNCLLYKFWVSPCHQVSMWLLIYSASHMVIVQRQGFVYCCHMHVQSNLWCSCFFFFG